MNDYNEFTFQTPRTLPIVMLLDTSGSMMEDGKIDELTNSVNEMVNKMKEQYHSKYSSIYLSQYQQILQELHEDNPEDIKDDPAKARPNPQTPTSHIDESQELMSEANPGAKSKIGKIEVTDLQFDF